MTIIEKYLDKEQGKWKNLPDTGADFLNDQNHYLKDLDILGERSLFQYLSICQTLGGRRKFVEKLSNPNLSEKKLKEEQQAILELYQNPDFMINFQIKMLNYQNKQIDLSKDFSQFTKAIDRHSKDFLIAGLCSIITIILLLLSLLKGINIQYFYGIFLFNILLSFMYANIYQSDFKKITTLVQNYGGIVPIINRMTKQNFHSSKLQKIKNNMQKNILITKKINQLDSLNSLKDNLIANFLFNGFFCLNLLLRPFFIHFINQYFPKLETNIKEIEEMEAIISLAGLGLLRQEKCLPQRIDTIEIKFQDIKHPLLEEKSCISNNFATHEGINIITGSNMGGKTSFLRTIGINLILMNAGTFTCATNFQANYFQIFTSMRIADDIDKGISTFYGELLRVKEALDYLGKGNMLVLIDEIFKGTNYQDRIYGAKQVIKRLNTKKTIVLLTTHDFELCDEANVKNYHVKESYEGDHIQFDYKIRPGKCNSTNAKYLMEKLGIIYK